MNKSILCALVLLVSAACSQDKLTVPGSIAPSSTAGTQAADPAVPLNYRAHLTGRDAVPAIDTLAQGEAIFQLSRDGTELSYKVIVSNIENVIGAHIHLGAPGVNGPNVFFLLDPQNAPGGGRTDGVLVTGAIESTDFPPSVFSMLIADIEAGNVYIDVPTNDGVMPPNTGPGGRFSWTSTRVPGSVS